MTDKLQIVGLSGKAGTGKDYLAQHYFAKHGFKQFSFAWHFKVWIVGKGDATHEEVFRTKPPEVRKMLQQEGTERGRNVYGENVWVKTLIEWLQVLHENMGLNRFVIPDVRFVNEVEGIQLAGGKVFRIIAGQRAANSGLSEEARKHISETQLDTYPILNYDGLIYNDPADVPLVGYTIDELINRHFPAGL